MYLKMWLQSYGHMYLHDSLKVHNKHDATPLQQEGACTSCALAACALAL